MQHNVQYKSKKKNREEGGKKQKSLKGKNKRNESQMKQQSGRTRKEQINARREAPLRSPYVCVSTCRNP